MLPELISWLGEQHLWIRVAGHRLLTNGQLSDGDISELANIIKDPALVADVDLGIEIANNENGAARELRLVSIGPVTGIDALGPRVPLGFGGHNITVVYGKNGSGKSGYSRILSRVCGKPRSDALRRNVFAENQGAQACTIKYSVGGTVTEVAWVPGPPIAALIPVDIFDSACGRFYLENETEASFLPPELAFMADLVTACNRVDSILASEERLLVSSLPQIEQALATTTAATSLRNISHRTTEEELSRLTIWNQENADEMLALNSRLSVADPLVAAQRLRRVRQQRQTMADAIENAMSNLTNLEPTRQRVTQAENTRRVANEATEALRAESEVTGVGSETWRALWQAAKAFSEGEAYPFHEYPVCQHGARCVLCHQELGEDARNRFGAFSSYVSGAIETAAITARRNLADHLAQIPTRPNQVALATAIQAADLPVNIGESVERAWQSLENHLEPIRHGKLPADPIVIDEVVNTVVLQIRGLADSAEAEAAELVRSANPEARRADEVRLRELRAQRWISEQVEAIRSEQSRLRRVHEYQQFRRQADTRGISRKAGEFSHALVTDAYISRFNSELGRLGARGISVELVHTRTERGRSKHVVRLRGALTGNAPVAEILSEGERRIISLAAFLADVTGRNMPSPFVFDDPISSLDQTWEEKTIDRLIEISATRQVIVFTHRLSLLSIISDKADEMQTVYISREPWGTGEPGELPLDAKKPDRAMADLKNRRLVQARAELNANGTESYYPLGKAICSDFRILLERMIEFVLLADVVQRHRRAINTQGKMNLLPRIKPADCALIERMMGKYSCYEHSQSAEAPVQPLTPDEIGTDIDEMLAWHAEFTARQP